MPDDLLRPSFGNVAVPAQILPCIDVDLNRGVARRQFENIFPRRGDEVSRTLVSLERSYGREKATPEERRVAPPPAPHRHDRERLDRRRIESVNEPVDQAWCDTRHVAKQNNRATSSAWAV